MQRDSRPCNLANYRRDLRFASPWEAQCLRHGELRNFAINIWACRQKHGKVPPDNFGAYVLLASNFIVVIINHHYLSVYNTLVW